MSSRVTLTPVADFQINSWRRPSGCRGDGASRVLPPVTEGEAWAFDEDELSSSSSKRFSGGPIRSSSNSSI